MERYKQIIEEEDNIILKIESAENCMEAIYEYKSRYDHKQNEETVKTILILISNIQNDYRLKLIDIRIDKVNEHLKMNPISAYECENLKQ